MGRFPLNIQICRDGIKIIFPMFSLNDFQFHALMACLKRNRESGKIMIHDSFLDKNNTMKIWIGGIDGYVEQFIQLLECELLMKIETEKLDIYLDIPVGYDRIEI